MATKGVSGLDLGEAAVPAEKAPEIEVGQPTKGNDVVFVTSKLGSPFIIDPGPKQVVIVMGMNAIPRAQWERNRGLATIQARLETQDFVEHDSIAAAAKVAKRIVDGGAPALIPPSMVDKRIDLDGIASRDFVDGQVTMLPAGA